MKPEPWYRLADPGSIATPALLVYRQRLAANLRRAVEIAGDPARLRPHVKTHKCPKIVGLMLQAGIERYKCATVAEAHMLAQTGAPDVLLAYPLVGENARRFGRLAAAYPDVRFGAAVDSGEGIRALSASLGSTGATAAVWVDVDVGMHRTGVSPEGALELYREASGSPCLRAVGLHLYDGHNHGEAVAERARVVEQAWRTAAALRDRIAAAGLGEPRFVAGGTPSFPMWAAYPGVELSPGTCFLHDAGYLRAYPDLGFEPAALILSRVVSRPGEGRLCLDCGHKAIAADPPGERAVALNLRGARTLMQNEEHWVMGCEDAGAHAVGEEVYLLPTHICPCFALHREVLVVEEDGSSRERWPVTARDRSLGI